MEFPGRDARSVLGGFRVVETAGLAAELAGRLLADLGAEVLKVEPPAGAPTRRISRHFFEYYDAGKRSVVVDEGDDDRLRALLSSADVWLDSFSGLVVDHPRLVVARVTPFGRTSDFEAQAAGGMVAANGGAQGFGLQAYHAASLYTVIGILLALYERERSGLGQTIECNLRDAVAGALEHSTASWNHLFRVCRARDGQVVLGLLCDWTTLVGWLAERGQGTELAGEEWQDFFHRERHADAAFAVLERWASELGAEEIFEGAQLRRIPFAAVRSPEHLPKDPQLEARAFFEKIPGTNLRFPGPPFRMSKTPLQTRSPAPPLGDFPRRDVQTERAEHEEERKLERSQPLQNTRILDFTHVVAGPIATRILADHGADVVKVERPTTLDVGDRRGGVFGNLNRGKRSIVLDFADPRDLALARRLAAASDVVIDNFSARVMPALGLDYVSLRPLRADIVTIGMSGFGSTGPLRDYVSFGPTLHALCGHTAMMPPAGWGFSHSDVCAGLNAAIAAVAALLHRARTGEGQAVDLSQFESVTTLMGPMLLDVANGGPPPTPPGNRSQEAPAAGDEDDRTRFAATIEKPVPQEASPIELSATPSRVARPGPLHGEHTEEVLAELGLSRGAASSASG